MSRIDDAACCGTVLAALDDERAAVLASAYSALGDPVRLKLLACLSSADGGEVCVCNLVPAVGKTQGTVSHHLRILSQAGIVTGERRGKWVWYSVVPDRLRELQEALEPL